MATADRSLRLKAALLSLLLLALLLGVWHLATLQPPPAPAPATQAAAPALTPEQIEYAKLMGKDPTAAAGGTAEVKKSGFPNLAQMAGTIARHLAEPFYDRGPNDKGIGLQRRMLRRAIETVAAGGDPPGVSFEESAVVKVPSGNFFTG